ncbi:hypothetical protein CTAYLR_001572 [Chrysophaeum taylorii]|uniref:Uncharacterized protein n=1 Tax=Chrysophaeum taylorii TaxID=2483200 RepID=A0AAD7UDB6_9STRA|nr:hypothetical protein CTAYLR_001572 [Chrysophaeum taylorii]
MSAAGANNKGNARRWIGAVVVIGLVALYSRLLSRVGKEAVLVETVEETQQAMRADFERQEPAAAVGVVAPKDEPDQIMAKWAPLLELLSSANATFRELGQVVDISSGRWAAARQHAALEAMGLPRGIKKDVDMRSMRRKSRSAAIAAQMAFENQLPRLTESNRKDFTGFAAEELQELRLCNATSPSTTGVDFYFGEQFESKHAPPATWAYHFSPAFREGAAIGAMPGIMQTFGTKESYANIFAICDAYKLVSDPRVELCDDSLLYTFNVDADEQPRHIQRRYYSILEPRHVRHFERVYESVSALSARYRGQLWWIIKPQSDSFFSRGMHLSKLEFMPSKVAFVRWVNVSIVSTACLRHYNPETCSRRKVSFQRYLHTPATVYGRKFDMRAWVLVTSINPLRVFMMRHAYPKIASEAFSRAHSDMDKQCMHIKMLVPDESCDATLEDFIGVFAKKGYPKSTATQTFFDALRFPGLSVFNNRDKKPENLAALAEHVWATKVWPALEAAIIKILMLVRPQLLAAEREARDAGGGGSSSSSKKYRRFALLSPDVAVDDRGRPSVIEINTNGHLMGQHDEQGGFDNLFHDEGYVQAMFEVLGANDYPRRRAYEGKLDAAIERYCAEEERCGDDNEIIEAMRQAVHEEAHSGPHWYRVYPPIKCRSLGCEEYEGEAAWWPEQARVSRSQRASFGETHLDAAVRSFLETVDTSEIHGIPLVPGHGRWPPRLRFPYEGTT